MAQAAQAGPAHRALRVALGAGLDHAEVSDWSGIPIASYARLERAQVANPRLRQLVNLSLLFEVPLDELFQDDWRRWMQLHEEAPMRKPRRYPGGRRWSSCDLKLTDQLRHEARG